MIASKDFDRESIKAEINRFLFLGDDVKNKAQLEEYVSQIERRNKLEHYFNSHPEDLDRDKNFSIWRDSISKNLRYQDPYRIAIIGMPGMGKSTLINALLAEDIVLTKPFGKAATGTVLEIYLNAPTKEEEVATVNPRDQQDIIRLIENFLFKYKIEDLDISLDSGFIDDFATKEPAVNLTDDDRDNFQTMRQILVNILKQFISQNLENLKDQYFLKNPTARKKLNDLIDEDGEQNRNPNNRPINLIRSVTYQIFPRQNSDNMETLKLPPNVCLVDLPGLDGSPLHNVLIEEGIKDADAVIFLPNPERMDTLREEKLLKPVKKYVAIEETSEAGERVFFVLNRLDKVEDDTATVKVSDLPDMPRLMRELMDGLVKDYSRKYRSRGGEHPYFTTSAKLAYNAQLALQGKALEWRDTSYSAAKDRMGVKNGSDQDALIASGVPHLVTTLNEFAQKQRIDGQIRDAKQLLDSTINRLRSLLQQERDALQEKQGEFVLQEQVKDLLKNSEKEAEKLIRNFRREVLASLPRWQSNLSQAASSICDAVEQWTKENSPEIWKKNYIDIIYDPNEGIYSGPGLESFCGQIEVGIWQLLADRMTLLAQEIVETYETKLQNDQLAEKLFQQCQNYITLEKLSQYVNQPIEKMGTTLEKISSRIAHTVITDPNNILISEGTESQTLEKSSLVTSLGNVPEPSLVSESDFDPFISQVRQRYETIVTEQSVKALLNVFRYETLLIRNNLRSRISNVFSEMSTDSEYMNQIAAELSAKNEDLAKVSLLNQKLREINDI